MKVVATGALKIIHDKYTKVRGVGEGGVKEGKRGGGQEDGRGAYNHSRQVYEGEVWWAQNGGAERSGAFNRIAVRTSCMQNVALAEACRETLRDAS